jgi:hypothetical protein
MPSSSLGLSHEDRTSQSSGCGVSDAAPLLWTVTETLQGLRLSRGTFYVLVSAGELETVKIGSATRTVVASAKGYVERLLEGKSRLTNNPPRNGEGRCRLSRCVSRSRCSGLLSGL